MKLSLWQAGVIRSNDRSTSNSAAGFRWEPWSKEIELDRSVTRFPTRWASGPNEKTSTFTSSCTILQLTSIQTQRTIKENQLQTGSGYSPEQSVVVKSGQEVQLRRESDHRHRRSHLCQWQASLDPMTNPSSCDPKVEPQPLLHLMVTRTDSPSKCTSTRAHASQLSHTHHYPILLLANLVAVSSCTRRMHCAPVESRNMPNALPAMPITSSDCSFFWQTIKMMCMSRKECMVSVNWRCKTVHFLTQGWHQ